MAIVATEEFVWSLTNQCHFNILTGSEGDVVHGYDRGGSNGFLNRRDDMGKGLIEDRLVELHLLVGYAENARSFSSLCKFIVTKGIPEANGVGSPITAVLHHQGKQ